MGFGTAHWIDKTQETLVWFREYRAKVAAEGPPPLHVGMLIGLEFKEMSANMVRNLEEGRVAIFQAVLERK